MRLLVSTSLIAAFSMATGAATAPPAPCLSGLTASLKEGHFTGPIVCSPKRASFRLVGKTARGEFSIYDYRYRYRPSGASVDHGGQKILVFHGGKYLGQYAASPPPYVSLSIGGSVVRFAGPANDGNIPLDFSNGPPRKALIGGLEVDFFR